MSLLKSHAGKVNPIVIIASVIVAAVLIAVFVFAIGGSKSRLEPFPTDGYLQSPQNFLGNSYQVDAQVDSVLNYRPGVGRLLVVKSDGRPIPVFLPEGLVDSIHTGQRYHLDVMIGNGGLIYINDLKKY